jgi:CheY-like chemotaxis protein
MSDKKLIFIVDDDPIINKLIERRFTSEGYIVEAFSYGEDCLKSLDKNPDLIILDYLFISKDHKVMNGLEVFSKIKETKPAIRVIMLSGQEDGELVLELARKGIDDYVIKDKNLLTNLNTAITEIFS